ncbi:MAG: septum formation family protein [Marmoricola sp.]
MLRRFSVLLLVGGLALCACDSGLRKDDESDRVTAPPLGACRALSAADLTSASNHSAVVPCTRAHTAQTFAVGRLPASTGSTYADKRHGGYVYSTCQLAFAQFLGADESTALRSRLSWAWFRPSARGWSRGARWYRCDLVGGESGARRLQNLPRDAKGLFSTSTPDAWMTCSRGATVAGGTKVACSQPHSWRAVTTVKVGQPADPYPGDRLVQVRSRDYCHDSVGGWMHYPPDYDFGFTWFKADRWAAGNRRSICWARTPQ